MSAIYPQVNGWRGALARSGKWLGGEPILPVERERTVSFLKMQHCITDQGDCVDDKRIRVSDRKGELTLDLIAAMEGAVTGQAGEKRVHAHQSGRSVALSDPFGGIAAESPNAPSPFVRP